MSKLVRILAEGVMGWEHRTGIIRGGHWIGKGIPMMLAVNDWNPLDNWNDCMMVVEQMERDGFTFWLTSARIGASAIFAKLSPTNIHAECKGAPRKAICKAALKARGLIE